METKIFSTRKLAKEYVAQNYPDNYTEFRVIYDGDSSEFIYYSQFADEFNGMAIMDDNHDIIECVAWLEDEDNMSYTITVDGKQTAEYDNIYDARVAAEKAEAEEDGEVKLFCNGEEIDKWHTTHK